MEIKRKDEFTKAELNDMETANYNLVTDLSKKINYLKDYETAYGNPRKGKMIINHKGTSFLVDFMPLPGVSLDEAFETHRSMFD